MLLYKYKSFGSDLSFKNALDSIQYKYLYFSRPSQLNDPFDCQIQVDFSATDKEYLQWIKNNKKKMIPGNKLSTVDGIKKAIKEPEFIDGLKRSTIDLVEVNHILSVTPDCFNESMWGLYAGNYNGICIGYKIPDTDFYNMMGNRYSTKVFYEDNLLDEIIFGYNVSAKIRDIRNKHECTQFAGYFVARSSETFPSLHLKQFSYHSIANQICKNGIIFIFIIKSACQN